MGIQLHRLPQFNIERTNIFDKDRPGYSRQVTTPEMVDKFHGIILDDRQMKLREIVNSLNISRERVHQ